MIQKKIGWVWMVGMWVFGGIAHADPQWDSLSEKLFNQDKTTWQDQKGKSVHLADFANRPIVISMAYSSCKKTCPLLTIAKMKEIQAKYDEKKWAADFIILSLDPNEDTSEVLLQFQKKSGVVRDNWHFLRATEAETRKVATYLGLANYWQMDDHIQHDFKVLILNPKEKSVKKLDWEHRNVASVI